MYGWTGTILRIDLSEGKIVKENTTQELCLDFLGGEGFGVKWLYDQVPPGTDPFDPQMIFVIATGPLTGTLCPASGRLEILTKSRRTGILGDTIEEITREKVEVIKKGARAATISDDRKVQKIFIQKSQNAGAEYYIHGKDFKISRKNINIFNPADHLFFGGQDAGRQSRNTG